MPKKMIDRWGNTVEFVKIPIAECELLRSIPESEIPEKELDGMITVLDKCKTPSGKYTVVQRCLLLAQVRAKGKKYIWAWIVMKGWWEKKEFGLDRQVGRKYVDRKVGRDDTED